MIQAREKRESLLYRISYIYLPKDRNARKLPVFEIRAAHRSRTISSPSSSLFLLPIEPLSLPLISHAPPEGWEVDGAVEAAALGLGFQGLHDRQT
jgi:hypothetical protein